MGLDMLYSLGLASVDADESKTRHLTIQTGLSFPIRWSEPIETTGSRSCVEAASSRIRGRPDAARIPAILARCSGRVSTLDSDSASSARRTDRAVSIELT